MLIFFSSVLAKKFKFLASPFQVDLLQRFKDKKCQNTTDIFLQQSKIISEVKVFLTNNSQHNSAREFITAYEIIQLITNQVCHKNYPHQFNISN